MATLPPRLTSLLRTSSWNHDYSELSMIDRDVTGAGFLNDSGDKTGAKLTGDTVTMPPGFQDAYRAFVEGGWNGLPVETEWDGQGLPWTVAMAVQEMLQAANIISTPAPTVSVFSLPESTSTHSPNISPSLITCLL